MFVYDLSGNTFLLTDQPITNKLPSHVGVTVRESGREGGGREGGRGAGENGICAPSNSGNFPRVSNRSGTRHHEECEMQSVHVPFCQHDLSGNTQCERFLQTDQPITRLQVAVMTNFIRMSNQMH